MELSNTTLITMSGILLLDLQRRMSAGTAFFAAGGSRAMRITQILVLRLTLIVLACTVAWLSPLLAQPSPETLNLTFTTIVVPGAAYTNIWGINTAGDMVGNYGQNAAVDSHGFKY